MLFIDELCIICVGVSECGDRVNCHVRRGPRVVVSLFLPMIINMIHR